MKELSLRYEHRMQNEPCLLTFEVFADLHVLLPKRNRKLENALDDIWERKVKDVIILGDLSAQGFMFQLEQCLKQCKEYPIRYMIALGNHDIYSMKEKAQVHIHPLYKELVLLHHSTLYYEEQREGFSFYVLNSEKPDKNHAYYSPQQLLWLKEHLEKADPHKPVFICCHHPLMHTHPNMNTPENTMGFQSHELTRIVNIHPLVIFLSAHIHNSYEICTIYCDHKLFEINVPSFTNTQYGGKKEEIGYQLQLFHDFLYIRTRDYHTHEWILSHEYILNFKSHQCIPYTQEAHNA